MSGVLRPRGTSRRNLGLVRRGVLVGVALLLASCGNDSNPASPTGLASPTLSSPSDDAIAPARPTLVVNNVATAQAGARTYDFQLADSTAALTGPESGLLGSASGIAEGANGLTSYAVNRDLPLGQRYYWRSRVTQGGVAGPWSSAFRFRTASTVNQPPVIQSITVGNNRAEASAEIDVVAVVTDQETNPSSLIYTWTATGGVFKGTGASVRWQAPAVTDPAAFDLTLTVIERYTVPVGGGGEETRENRVIGQATVHVNDSPKEITGLASTFIDDFIHSERSPEFCVRNFSDSCQGKQDELGDIRTNRAMFVIDPSASGLGAGSITFYDSASVTKRQVVPASQSGFAEFLGPCHFASTNKATGVFGVAVGTCQLTSVYEDWRWRLCDSHFLPAASSAHLSLFRF
jgi:hypothetical protein